MLLGLLPIEHPKRQSPRHARRIKRTLRAQAVEHPSAGALDLVGNPVRLESLQGKSVRLPPPLLGEHSLEALQAWGIATERIDALIKSNVLHRD